MNSLAHRVVILATIGIATGIACGKTDKPSFTMADFKSDPTPPGPLHGLFLTTDNGSDLLSAVDPVTRTVKWSIPVGFNPVELEGPHHITPDPAGQYVYLNLSEAVIGSGSGPHGAHGTGIIQASSSSSGPATEPSRHSRRSIRIRATWPSRPTARRST